MITEFGFTEDQIDNFTNIAVVLLSFGTIAWLLIFGGKND